MVPVSAEDFARAKRRVVFKWLGGGLLVVLVGVGIYEKSTSSQDGRKAFSDGEQMLKVGRYAEAIQSLDRALTVDKGMANAYLLRGRAKVALGQIEPAVRDFTKVIQLQPAGTDAFVERAAIHLGTNDYPAVIADCGEAISRNPKLTYAYTLRGMAFREMGNLPKSLEDFNHAVELAPALDTYFQRATTYQSMGDHAKALADLDQVVSLSRPVQWDTWRARSLVRLRATWLVREVIGRPLGVWRIGSPANDPVSEVFRGFFDRADAV